MKAILSTGAAGVLAQQGGSAEEVTEAMLWLASDKASYSSGTFLDVS